MPREAEEASCQAPAERLGEAVVTASGWDLAAEMDCPHGAAVVFLGPGGRADTAEMGGAVAAVRWGWPEAVATASEWGPALADPAAARQVNFEFGGIFKQSSVGFQLMQSSLVTKAPWAEFIQKLAVCQKS